MYYYHFDVLTNEFTGFVPIASASLSTAIRPYMHLDGLYGSVEANFRDRPFIFGIKDFISATSLGEVFNFN